LLGNGEGRKEASHVLSLQTTLEENMGELNNSIIEIQVQVIRVWFLILRQNDRVLQNMVLRKIFGSQKENVTREQREIA
jgi:hypothetical protein